MRGKRAGAESRRCGSRRRTRPDHRRLVGFDQSLGIATNLGGDLVCIEKPRDRRRDRRGGDQSVGPRAAGMNDVNAVERRQFADHLGTTWRHRLDG